MSSFEFHNWSQNVPSIAHICQYKVCKRFQYELRHFSFNSHLTKLFELLFTWIYFNNWLIFVKEQNWYFNETKDEVTPKQCIFHCRHISALLWVFGLEFFFFGFCLRLDTECCFFFWCVNWMCCKNLPFQRHPHKHSYCNKTSHLLFFLLLGLVFVSTAITDNSQSGVSVWRGFCSNIYSYWRVC